LEVLLTRVVGNAFVIMLSLYTMSENITFMFISFEPARSRKIRPIRFGRMPFIASRKTITLYTISKMIPFLFVSLVTARNRKI